MALKDKGVVNRAIVTPDKHFPLHDQKSINVVCKAIEIVKPDIYIDLGDVGEWGAFSAWKYKRKKAPPLEFMVKGVEALNLIDPASLPLLKVIVPPPTVTTSTAAPFVNRIFSPLADLTRMS